MESWEYDKLRKKRKEKDFEGKFKKLNKYLYGFSFFSNAVSIFFAFFLLYPILKSGVSSNLTTGFWCELISISLSLLFLTIFEIIKRYVDRNFSQDYLQSNNKIHGNMYFWLFIVLILNSFSFYLSIDGSKNLISNVDNFNKTIEIKNDTIRANIEKKYYILIDGLRFENESLRINNDTLRAKILTTSNREIGIRRDYQSIINSNTGVINNNNKLIDEYQLNLDNEIRKFDEKNDLVVSENTKKNNKYSLIFIVFVVFNEIVIFAGVFLNEYYEDKLYHLNFNRFEDSYKKREQYRTLLSYVYDMGRFVVGDNVVGVSTMKEILKEKTKLSNSNKLVDEFYYDMDLLNIFKIQGKRRIFGMNFDEALKLINDYDDSSSMLKNL